MSFTRTQAGVAAAMAAGLLLTIAPFLWPRPPVVSADPQARIGLWLACSSVTSTWLLISVGRLAGHRFFTQADIDGGGLRANTAQAALLQALLQNTLEQTALAIPAYGAWLWLGPPDQLGLVIVFTAYFAVGRLLFLAGYRYGAPIRALGFTLTFYPTVALTLVALPAALARMTTA